MSNKLLARREWQIVIGTNDLIKKLEWLNGLYFNIQIKRDELSELYEQKENTRSKSKLLDIENDIENKKWEIEKKEKSMLVLKNTINNLVHSIDKNAYKHIVDKTEGDIIICYEGKYASTKRHFPIYDTSPILEGVDIPSTAKITRSLREVLS